MGIPPEKDNLQNVSYETDIPEYEKNFDENGIFYCPDVSELPLNLREILEPQGIISLLHCAIRDNGVFRGYIGFDECSTKRLWTKEQIQTLTFFSELLGVFLLKQQAQKAMSLKLDNLNTILDNQNNWIYVIDPDTHQLQFLNAKLKATSAHTEEGHICYKTLRGLDAPCPGCPAQDIREKKNAEQIIPNPKEGVDALCEATLIRWDGKDACLMSCQEIRPWNKQKNQELSLLIFYSALPKTCSPSGRYSGHISCSKTALLIRCINSKTLRNRSVVPFSIHVTFPCQLEFLRYRTLTVKVASFPAQSVASLVSPATKPLRGKKVRTA